MVELVVSDARWHLPIQHTWLQSQKQELHEEKASTREDPAWETISIYIILISRAPTAPTTTCGTDGELMAMMKDSLAGQQRFFWQNSLD